MADKNSEGSPVDSERNSLRQARPRERKRPPPEQGERPARGPAVDSLYRVPVRQAAGAVSAPSASQKGEAPDKPSNERHGRARVERDDDVPPPQTVPDHVRKRFVQVGRKYYFPDGARAFTDRGHRLTTASENAEVIKSLVEIAQARGWSEIRVHGTERFRREAWMTAKMAGLDVRGYRPTEFEEGKMVRLLAERVSPERRPAPHPAIFEPREREDRGAPQFVGTLLEHGRAPYKQDPKEPMSYFVRLRTVRGERTVWGVDLERAFKESITQPTIGDAVGLVPARRDAVKINVPERDADGKVSGQKSLETHRNRWVVEKQSFFEGRTRAAQALLDPSVSPRQGVKDHPELVGTYLQVKAAQLAAQQMKSPADRQMFVARVRSALAESVARGEPLPTVQIKERTPTRRGPRATEQAQGR